MKIQMQRLIRLRLGFQIDGDTEPTLFWFYNCTATRPNIDASTTEDTKEPGTDTLTISCASKEDGTVRAKTTATSYAAVKDTWFTSVYEKIGGSMMRRTITISGIQCEMKSSAAIPRMYRMKFERDIFVDMQKIAKQIEVQNKLKEELRKQAEENGEEFDESKFESGLPVETGEFGADMKVDLLNDGPVTLWMDTAQMR